MYLIEFPALGVFKVGLTHARDDRRLDDHELNGGRVVETVVVPSRSAARQVEQMILGEYGPWRAAGIGPTEFPQGGYTETWVDDPNAPRCELNRYLKKLVLVDQQ